jgi:hypothetical protein
MKGVPRTGVNDGQISKHFDHHGEGQLVVLGLALFLEPSATMGWRWLATDLKANTKGSRA